MINVDKLLAEVRQKREKWEKELDLWKLAQIKQNLEQDGEEIDLWQTMENAPPYEKVLLYYEICDRIFIGAYKNNFSGGNGRWNVDTDAVTKRCLKDTNPTMWQHLPHKPMKRK